MQSQRVRELENRTNGEHQHYFKTSTWEIDAWGSKSFARIAGQPGSRYFGICVADPNLNECSPNGDDYIQKSRRMGLTRSLMTSTFFLKCKNLSLRRKIELYDSDVKFSRTKLRKRTLKRRGSRHTERAASLFPRSGRNLRSKRNTIFSNSS